jgi:hypothetical protein
MKRYNIKPFDLQQGVMIKREYKYNLVQICDVIFYQDDEKNCCIAGTMEPFISTNSI